MPVPSIPCWVAVRSSNTTTHPGAVDISMEEEMVVHLPKTPGPKKRMTKTKKDAKPAEEVEAGIQHIAAYEQQLSATSLE